MNPYSENWKQIAELLRAARDTLALEGNQRGSDSVAVGVLTGSLQEFEEFLDQNELELAWDALTAVAGRVNAPRACWHKLAEAAKMMRLQDKEQEAARRAATTP